MISEIRSYVKATIQSADSDLKEHDSYFVSDNIASTRIEDTYHLFIGDMSITRQNTTNVGSFAITVKVWKNGRNEELDNIDKAYCSAIDIQTLITNQTRIDQIDYIKSIDGTGIEIVAVEENDNLAEFKMNFTVTVTFDNI